VIHHFYDCFIHASGLIPLADRSFRSSLIAIKIVVCEEKGLSFEEVVSEVEKYIEEMNTFFVLENLETLRKNGRLGRVKALVASALKIKPDTLLRAIRL